MPVRTSATGTAAVHHMVTSSFLAPLPNLSHFTLSEFTVGFKRSLPPVHITDILMQKSEVVKMTLVMSLRDSLFRR